MTWLKVDDSFYDHPKVFDASDAAVALWVRAGCWSARNLTDGFVPAGMPARLSTSAEEASAELVRRGLWLRVRGGYEFHDWREYQPTREAVEAERASARERMRLLRSRRRGAGQIGNGSAELQAKFAGSSQPPSRPVPPPSGERGGGTVRLLLPPWCGRCNKNTRMDVDDDDRTIRCPRCHPERRTA